MFCISNVIYFCGLPQKNDPFLTWLLNVRFSLHLGKALKSWSTENQPATISINNLSHFSSIFLKSFWSYELTQLLEHGQFKR